MSHWIKCSERLPEIGVEVLIRIPVFEHWNVEGGSYRGDGLWYGAWCSTRGKDKSYKVLEWAPMPRERKPNRSSDLQAIASFLLYSCITPNRY